MLIDDSAYECAAVRRELPQVEVIQTPARAVDVPLCLDKVARLEILSLTAEDCARTAMYAQDRERRELKRTLAGEGVDLGQHLRSLDMRMRVGFDDPRPLKRLAQLTQKTNQFNLTTRRYDEAAMQAMIEAPDWIVAHFSLADSFGDSGLVGLALAHLPGDGTARLDSVLMSCRVIGREAEAAFLETLLRELAARGVTHVAAQYLPTPKNMPAKAFLPTQRFTRGADGHWHRDLATEPPQSAETWPIAVDIVRA